MCSKGSISSADSGALPVHHRSKRQGLNLGFEAVLFADTESEEVTSAFMRVMKTRVVENGVLAPFYSDEELDQY